jgi:hypothetical protein
VAPADLPHIVALMAIRSRPAVAAQRCLSPSKTKT